MNTITLAANRKGTETRLHYISFTTKLKKRFLKIKANMGF